MPEGFHLQMLPDKRHFLELLLKDLRHGVCIRSLNGRFRVEGMRLYRLQQNLYK